MLKQEPIVKQDTTKVLYQGRLEEKFTKNKTNNKIKLLKDKYWEEFSVTMQHDFMEAK